MQPERKPHAVLDIDSRHQKARKIEFLLGSVTASNPKLLEVGCGNGAIAYYFKHFSKKAYQVYAVDVVDQRQQTDGYNFEIVSDTRLPFENSMFDVVISNHVIEHVGDRQAQNAHLAELRRVLKPGGILYLAVPNRWMLVEPHYRLPLLSWVPRMLADCYIRLSGRHGYYDCWPLRLAECEAMLRAAGFEFRNVSDQAMLHFVCEEGKGGVLGRMVKGLPPIIRRRLLPIYPTLCFTASISAL